MKKLKPEFIFLLICNVFIISFANAQYDINYSGERMNLLSPQTYELAKYGNTNVSHYTGETNVNIPLYVYKDKDFELPISLGYNSSGFTPNKRESIVGLNWHLNAGGVNGVPDELHGTGATAAPPVLHGYLFGIRDINNSIKTFSPADIFGCTGCVDISITEYVH